MKFEAFADTEEVGKRSATDQLEEVRVSQASRRDARSGPGKVESYLEEYDRLNGMKKEMETELSTKFNRSVYAKEQIRIRKVVGGVGIGGQNRNKSFDEWIRVREEMDREKMRILERKNTIEKRMAAIKVKAEEERQLRKIEINKRAVGPRPLECAIERLTEAVDRMTAFLDRLESRQPNMKQDN